MSKRVILSTLICLVVLLTVVSLIVILLDRTAHHITDESYAEIKIGLTVHEVQRIFGVPAGDYGQGRISKVFCPPLSTIHRTDRPPLEWVTEKIMVRLYFDQDGVLQRKQLLQIERDTSLLEILKTSIKRRLGAGGNSAKHDYEEEGFLF